MSDQPPLPPDDAAQLIMERTKIVPTADPSTHLLLPFNVNHMVNVKLTDDGRRIHREHWTPFCELAGRTYEPPRVDAEGWSRFQLWDLMVVFGEHIGLAIPKPFEMTVLLEIFLSIHESPALENQLREDWDDPPGELMRRAADLITQIRRERDEALEILAIALPGPRPWPSESVESKLRVYLNMAKDRRRDER